MPIHTELKSLLFQRYVFSTVLYQYTFINLKYGKLRSLRDTMMGSFNTVARKLFIRLHFLRVCILEGTSDVSF
jgi:hypothetical protein